MPTKTIDEIAREAAEKIGEHPIDMGGLISFDAGDRREAQAVIGGIIAAAIREACEGLRGVATNMPPARTQYADGSRHSVAWLAGHKAARHQIAEAIAAALAEPEETPK